MVSKAMISVKCVLVGHGTYDTFSWKACSTGLKSLVWGPTGGHVHPPWTKILTMVFEGHMCLEYEMGCYHRSFRGKPVVFTRYPEVGENTLYSSGRNDVLFLSLCNHIYLANEQRYWHAVFCKCFLWCLLLTCMTKLPLPVTGSGKNWAILHVYLQNFKHFSLYRPKTIERWKVKLTRLL